MTVKDHNITKVPFFKVNEQTGRYEASRGLTEKQIIRAAKALLAHKVNRVNVFGSVDTVKDYLITHHSEHEREVFVCLFCDNRNRLIADEVMFSGTIDSAQVYPREVTRRALELNAAAIIFAHNHPSGGMEPSTADKAITGNLKYMLDLFNIRTLDHFIVGGGDAYSFASNGLI